MNWPVGVLEPTAPAASATTDSSVQSILIVEFSRCLPTTVYFSSSSTMQIKTISALAVAVIAVLLLLGRCEADDIFVESGGVVVGEAEAFSPALTALASPAANF